MIQFVSVSKLYKDVGALLDVSFTIEKGEFVLLTGHSGSGKSTVAKLLIREVLPSTGKIIVDDHDITRMWRWKVPGYRRKIGIVFQDFKLLDNKNIAENIAFALEVGGRSSKEIKEIVEYVLEIVGLENKAKAFPHELSGGQKQRIAIARAIANDPKILIADEPTGNLDADATWDIMEILQKINKWGTTVIMATHGQDIINKVDARVITLEEGKLESDSKEGDIKSNESFAEKMLEEKPSKKKKKKDKKKKESIKTKSEEQEKKDVEEKSKKEKEKDSDKKIKDKPENTKTQVELVKEKEEENEKENKVKPKKEEKKKPKLKIGLSNKQKKKEVKEIEEETKTEESKKTISNKFKDNKLSKSTRKLLHENKYNNMQDLIESGMEKINMIEDITGDQILEIKNAIKEFST